MTTSPCGDTTDDAPGLVARRGAVAVVAAVLDRGRIADETTLSGSPGERAEARALADRTLRHLSALDSLLGAYVQRLPKPPVLHILRVMAAELTRPDGSAHAAVDLAVRQTKAGPGARLSGLVNAVGRRIAARPELPQNAPLNDLPPWLAKTLVADWGQARAERIAEAHRAIPPIDLSLRQPEHTGHWADVLEADPLPGAGLRLASRPQISALPGYEDGAWWVQDAAAAIPAGLIPEPAGKQVLDLCAAPGGKTLQLTAAGAEVTALDISKARLARLSENLARTGLSARCVKADALSWQPETSFDAILLDAPCSATGTIRRHPDLPHRLKAKSLRELTDLQAKLLARAWDWVRPGGVLVFATCSILRAEGEEQVATFRKRMSPQPMPVTGPFANAQGDVRTLPCDWPERGGLDGFFAARFRKPT
ncbi:MAG: methyltransferase domain-containing protein [Pseudomonadota bacterium]